MSFTQPCFIRKNTLELRKKLEELGYTNGAWESPHFEYPYLKCFPNRKFGLFKGEGFYMTEDDYRLDGKVWTYNPPKEYIDCGTNEELFLALAALRDDTDKNQWFISNVDIFTECYNNEWKLYEDWCNIFTIEDLNSEISPIRKATTKEIIEHFKDK